MSDVAYEIIESQMIRGDIPPGAVLSEISLSQSIGIGRTPVRDALQRLTRNRLIAVIPRKGAIVSNVDVDQYLASLELRLRIEPVIIANVAATATVRQRTAIGELVERMHCAISDGGIAAVLEIDRQFKLIELAACENAFLKVAARPLHAVARRFYFAHASKPVPDVARAHAILMGKVASGDIDGARAASVAFLEAQVAFGKHKRQQALAATRMERRHWRKPLDGNGDLQDTLCNTAYQLLENFIVAGRYSTGQKLSVNRISQELGVGRTPVREALQRLESHHLVTILPRRGIVVADFDKYDFGKFLEARIALESYLCRLAARHATARQRGDLKATCKSLVDAVASRNSAAVIALDKDLKEGLILAADDAFLADAMFPIYGLARAFYFRNNAVMDMDVVRSQAVVVEAIVEGDEEEAALATVRFIAESARVIKKSLIASGATNTGRK